MRSIHGIVLVDKPAGPSSFEVVRLVRRAANLSRVGHAGTLDPLAEGLLVVCLGEGCKLVPFLQDSVKRYEVRIALGRETETLDREGAVTRQETVPPLDDAFVRQTLSSFVGRISQVPPIFSAIKKDGVKLYKKARLGEDVALEPREVFIDGIEMISLSQDALTLSVQCKKGTYIRSLARDIALALGTIGMVDFLRRTDCSGFQVENAMPFEPLARGENIEQHLIPMQNALPNMPKIIVDNDTQALLRNGAAVPPPETPIPYSDLDNPLVAFLSQDTNTLIAIARQQENGLQPVRVMLEE